MNELSFDSPIIKHPENLNIILKDHQLAIVKKCIDIESIENNTFGIMSDRPGTGKTYAILTLIYLNKIYNRANIIVVPQNIYTQWIKNIEQFSNNITYKKFINYEDIIMLYNNTNILKENDFILTTASYYHMIATTLSSLDIKIGRIFFDEIDSISNIISAKIESDFIWFVSASFNKKLLGYYESQLNNSDLINITCKCNDDFIDANILLDTPNKKYYLCKNIYIDNVLEKVLSKKELSSINALDYTLHNKIFNNKKANNEKDIIELILSNRKSIIDFDEIKIKEENERIVFYTDIKTNSEQYINDFKNNINEFIRICEFKDIIINFINNIHTILKFYYEITVDNKNLVDIFIRHQRDRVKTLISIFENMKGVFYNMTNITDICNTYFKTKIRNASVQNIQIQLKTMNSLNKTVIEIIDDIKLENDKSPNFNNDFNIFYNKYIDFNKLIINGETSLERYKDLNMADEQIDIHIKNISILEKRIHDNKSKIDFIYNRLKDNKCCPVCYNIFTDILCDKIYISEKCCNNKICGDCVEGWYSLNKDSCIFCNTKSIQKDDFIYYNNIIENENENETVCEKTNLLTNIDNDYIKKNNIDCEFVNYSKNVFLEDYIKNLKLNNKKIIIFSGYSNIFQYIQELCNTYDIGYVDLEKGNIKDIDISVHEYKYGNAQILLSNSTLFGCGMNLENADTIIFVHKMNIELERQVIGRAQRMGRKSVLEIIYLEYENESEFFINKNNSNNPLNIDLFNNVSYNESIFNDDELIGYYTDKQYANIINDIQTINFDNNISGNEILNDELSTTIEDVVLPDIPDEPIDVNLDELIASLV